jgi:hypothetical protein
MPDFPLTASAEELQARLVDLFVRLCGDPDDLVVAVESDLALDGLDAVLSNAAG